MAEIIQTPFGTYQAAPGGGFQPVYQTPFGSFVQAPGGGFQFAGQPAPATGTTGGTTGGGTEQVKCEPPYVYDEETNSCQLPSFIADRQRRRDDADRRARDEQQKLLEDQRKAAERGQTRAEGRQSANAIVGNLLKQYGLESLTQFVTDLIAKEDILSADVVLGRIRETEQYKKRFIGNEQRRARGLNALSEAEYIGMENAYRQTMRAAGLPQDIFPNEDDSAKLIAGDVSVAELADRINQGYLAVQQSNPQVINEMKRLYGVDDTQLAAYFLNPEKAAPMLMRQARSAQIASEARLQAGRELGQATAEELAVAGITQEQARQGFQTISQAEQLFVPLPGTTETGMTVEEQLGGVFGTSAAAQQRLRQRARERAAAFEAGGRFAGQGTTVTGLQ